MADPKDPNFSIQSLANQYRERAREALRQIDRSLETYHDQLQHGQKASRAVADQAEYVAKVTHIDQVAETVQDVDMVHGVAKGGWKLAQVLKNEETRRALLNVTKDTSALLRDPAALKARLDQELREFKRLQDAGSTEMKAGERLTLQEDGAAPTNRDAHGLAGKDAQSMHVAPQSAMRDLPNWEQNSSFTVPGRSELHRTVDEGWKREFQAMGKHGPSHITAKELEDVVGRSIDKSKLEDAEKIAMKQRLKDELYIDNALKESDLVRRPYSGSAATPTAPPPESSTGLRRVDVSRRGMRPQDQEVFQDVAREQNRWIAVRHTNPESLQYIGKEGFSPKQIECKAKTADVPVHPHAGLVVDPSIHPDAFKDPAAAQKYWNEMQKGLPEGYETNLDKSSPRYGCLQHQGKCIHGDYDLYDIVDPKHHQANLSLVTELHGQQHFQTRNLPAVGNSVNERIGSPMIQHGGEYQLQDHSHQRVMFFGPKGERFEVNGEKAIRDVYEEKFPGRLPPNHEHPFEPPTGEGAHLGLRVLAGTEQLLKPQDTPPSPPVRGTPPAEAKRPPHRSGESPSQGGPPARGGPAPDSPPPPGGGTGPSK